MRQVVLDIVSDVICPWCFVGKRRLERAIAELPGIAVVPRWRPFLLDPSLPPEGMPRRHYLARKFGAERLKTLHQPLIEIGAAEGIPFAFDRIAVTPNTIDAHRVIRWAHAAGRQNEMAERLFRLYFAEGGNPGDPGELARAAAEAGLDEGLVAARLATDEDRASVLAEIEHAQAMGVTGVPTFIAAGRYAAVGAHPPDALKDLIARAAMDDPA
jgi:predicted DsbA family dithiol-disulfide isomerase